MKTNRFWMDMTWSEIEKAAKAGKVLLVVFGTVEQHGPHLPTGVDAYLPMAIAEKVAEQIDGVVAPCANYGYKSLLRAGGGPHFPGSLGLRGTTMIAMVSDILQQILRQGWKRIVVLDWHLENVPFVFEGVDEALHMEGDTRDVKIIIIDDPNGLGVASEPGLQADLFGEGFPGWAVEHAAIWETSAMLAAFPELVHTDQIVDGNPPQPFDYDVLPTPINAAPKSGVFWKATRATREKGERILEAVTRGIVSVIQKEWGAATPRQNSRST